LREKHGDLDDSFSFTHSGSRFSVRLISVAKGYDCVTEGGRERSKPKTIDQIAVVGDLSATVGEGQLFRTGS
jgi:hypothetical protein